MPSFSRARRKISPFRGAAGYSAGFTILAKRFTGIAKHFRQFCETFHQICERLRLFFWIRGRSCEVFLGWLRQPENTERMPCQRPTRRHRFPQTHPPCESRALAAPHASHRRCRFSYLHFAAPIPQVGNPRLRPAARASHRRCRFSYLHFAAPAPQVKNPRLRPATLCENRR